MIEAIETAIIDRLKASLQGVLVDGFPEDVKAYERLPFNKGVVLVAYKGSTFSEPRAMGLLLQDRKLEFQVQLVIKGLRGHRGAYGYLDSIRALLTGFRPAGADPLYPTDEQFSETEEFLWVYGLTFTCNAPHVELAEEQLTPLVSKLTAEDDYGTVEV